MEKIYLPITLINRLPADKSEDLLEELMIMYYSEHQDELAMIQQRSGGDFDLYNEYRKDHFMDKVITDYAFDVDVLRRQDDPVATKLSEEIEKYNLLVEQYGNNSTGKPSDKKPYVIEEIE